MRYENSVLMIGSYESYLSRSVLIGLQNQGVEAVFTGCDISNLEMLNHPFRAYLVFADEELSVDMQFLVYLKDVAIERDVPIFMVGYDDELEAISTVVPSYLVHKSFSRPVNAANLERELVSFLLQSQTENKKKILVVDDSATDLRLMKNLLGEKYQVILASSGASAIVYLSQEHPDLILLDYEMPIVNGKQVLEMIRNESGYSDTPVIFLTQRGDKKSILDVMHLHPEGYLLKTMELDSVKNAIDDFFEKRKSFKT